MDIETVAEVIDRHRWTDDITISGPGGSPSYSSEQFGSTAHKTGNFLSHFGVHPDATVGIHPGPGMAPILSVFGAGLLGATVEFVRHPEDHMAVFIAPGDVWTATNPSIPPGVTGIAYRGSGTESRIRAFGRGVWSENPYCPTDPAVQSETSLFHSPDGSITHGSLIAAARDLGVNQPLATTDHVRVHGHVGTPESFLLGVLFPLLQPASIAFDAHLPDGDVTIRIVRSDGETRLDAADISLDIR